MATVSSSKAPTPVAKAPTQVVKAPTMTKPVPAKQVAPTTPPVNKVTTPVKPVASLSPVKQAISALSGNKQAQSLLTTTAKAPVTPVNPYQTQDDAQMKMYQDSLHQMYDPMIKSMNDYITGLKGQQAQQQQQAQDAFNQYMASLQSNRNDAMNLSDKNLNTTLNNVLGQNYLDALNNEQSLSNRGMATSGIGDEARTRLAMSGNRNLQSSYDQAAQEKNNIQSSFDQNSASAQSQFNTNMANLSSQYGGMINDANQQLLGMNPDALAAQKFADYQAAGGYAAVKAQTDATNAKTMSDFADAMSKQTGYAYNPQTGQVMKDSKGNPIRTLDGQKVDTSKATAISNADHQKTVDTGLVYANGQALKDSKGHYITSAAYNNMTATQKLNIQKANETARHDKATEATAQKNANTNYSKMLGDLATKQKQLEISASNSKISAARLQLDKNKYDDSVNKYLAQLNNQNVTRKVSELQKQRDYFIKLATAKGATGKQKTDSTNQIKSITSQISATLNSATTGK